MLFELKSVFLNEGHTQQLSYELDIADMDIDGVFPFTSPVAVTATAHNRTGLVTLTLDCRYDYTRSCDRCSETFTRREEKSFTHYLAQTLVDDTNDDYITDILLDLPQKNLCREDCRGLCPDCGQNLNAGSCACSGKSVDPRLEILKQLMD